MRRSARDTKPPEFLTYTQRHQGKVQARSVSPTPESGEEDEEYDESLEGKKKKKVTKSMEEHRNSNGFSLFEDVFAAKQVKTCSASWLENFQSSKASSLTELFNFILKASGIKSNLIPEDVDLDALNGAELQEMISDLALNSHDFNAKAYPLLDKAKFKGFRKKFQSFWEHLVLVLTEMKETANSKGIVSLKGPEILGEIMEKISALTLVSISSIRDASTEAVLSISGALIPHCRTLKEAKIVAQRQLNNGDLSSVAKKDKVNPKSKAFADQQSEYSKRLQLWSQLIDRTFEDVFFHRCKDSTDDVRWTCILHLKDLILFDPERNVKVEYLKYLARGFYDYSHSVRIESVQILKDLIEDDRILRDLAPFVLRYMDRFIEIASGDIDTSISVEMISTMRVMQRQGFLDSLTEDKLDLVDVIIFDPSATDEMRKEALLFMMDHTQGFDTIEGFEGTSTTSKKGSGKRKRGGSTENNELQRKKNVALQLETLTEFAEHNLGETVEWSSLLADACLLTDKCVLLYDWSTSVSLLSREQEDLIANALRPLQVNILLQMFVRAAVKVMAQKREIENGTADSDLIEEEHTINSRWESLNNVLQIKLPLLLTRFKDDQDNLAALSELLSCCDLRSIAKSNQALLTGLQDIFLTFTDESLLKNIVKAIKRWKTSTLSNSTETMLKILCQSLWENLCSSLDSFRKSILVRNDETKKKRSSKKGSTEEKDVLFSLSSLIMRIKVLFESIDCRDIFPENPALLVAKFREILEAFLDSLNANAENIHGKESGRIHKLSEDLFGVLFFILMWDYHQLINDNKITVNEFRVKHGEGVQNEEELQLEHIFTGSQRRLFEEKVHAFLELRKAMVEAAAVGMRTLHQAELKSAQHEDQISEEGREFLESVALAAFQFVSSLRTFFPQKQDMVVGLDSLRFIPSQEVLALMKFSFDVVSQEISHKFEALNEDNVSTDKALSMGNLSAVLVEKLLLPLSGSFAFDIQHLSRQQAAAVFQFILHRDQQVQETVKLIAKQLRDLSLIAYLEVQFVTLKTCFKEEVLIPIQQRQEAEETDADEFDFGQNDAQIATGYEKLVSYSRKFSSLLGVGKLKDAALEAVDAFLKLALDFTLGDFYHAGFAEAMSPFLRFLPASNKQQLHDHITAAINDNVELKDEIRNQSGSPNREFSKFLTFFHGLTGGKDAIKSSKRKISVETKELEGENEDDQSAENEAVVVTPQKNAKSNAANRMRLSATRGSRKSSRNISKQQVSYTEAESDEDRDDEIEEDVEPPSQKKRKSEEFSFATGLDIDDVSEADSDVGRRRKKRATSDQRQSNHLGFSQSNILDSAPIAAPSQELAAIPSRRRLLG